MKTQEEIQGKIEELLTKTQTKNLKAVIDVLENDLSDEDIEDKYFDENDPWLEQDAYRAREWMDGKCSDEEFNEYN
jgi:hypothetical protein